MALEGGVRQYNIQSIYDFRSSGHNSKAQQESKCLFRPLKTAGLCLSDGQKKKAAY